MVPLNTVNCKCLYNLTALTCYRNGAMRGTTNGTTQTNNYAQKICISVVEAKVPDVGLHEVGLHVHTADPTLRHLHSEIPQAFCFNIRLSKSPYNR
jgi:hypothetical protein